MSADPNVFRYSVGRVSRARTWMMLFAPITFAVVLAIGIVGVFFSATASQRHFYRLDLALSAWCLGWTTIIYGALFIMYRGSGVYLQGAQVGELFVGRRRPIRADITHWRRKTVVNPAGFGRSRDLPVLYAMTGEGQRLLGVSTRFLEAPEMDRLVARSGLPVEGDWSDRVTLRQLRKDLPLAAAARLSSRLKLLVALAGVAEVLALAGTGFLAVHLAQ